MLKNKHKREQLIKDTGFTLIETLVAITVLLAAIAGPLTIVTRSLAEANLAKDRLTATYYAQGGLEIIRYNRDSEILDGDAGAWLSRVAACETADGCTAHSRTGANFFACQPEGCPPATVEVSWSDALIDYYPSGRPITIFTRTIYVVETEPGEAEITSTVTWPHKNRPQQVSITERLKNLE